MNSAAKWQVHGHHAKLFILAADRKPHAQRVLGPAPAGSDFGVFESARVTLCCQMKIRVRGLSLEGLDSIDLTITWVWGL